MKMVWRTNLYPLCFRGDFISIVRLLSRPSGESDVPFSFCVCVCVYGVRGEDRCCEYCLLNYPPTCIPVQSLRTRDCMVKPRLHIGGGTDPKNRAFAQHQFS